MEDRQVISETPFLGPDDIHPIFYTVARLPYTEKISRAQLLMDEDLPDPPPLMVSADSDIAAVLSSLWCSEDPTFEGDDLSTLKV